MVVPRGRGGVGGGNLWDNRQGGPLWNGQKRLGCQESGLESETRRFGEKANRPETPAPVSVGICGRFPDSIRYRWRDSNPHGAFAPTDFKSVVSAISPHRLSLDQQKFLRFVLYILRQMPTQTRSEQSSIGGDWKGRAHK